MAYCHTVLFIPVIYKKKINMHLLSKMALLAFGATSLSVCSPKNKHDKTDTPVKKHYDRNFVDLDSAFYDHKKGILHIRGTVQETSHPQIMKAMDHVNGSPLISIDLGFKNSVGGNISETDQNARIKLGTFPKVGLLSELDIISDQDTTSFIFYLDNFSQFSPFDQAMRVLDEEYDCQTVRKAEGRFIIK